MKEYILVLNLGNGITAKVLILGRAVAGCNRSKVVATDKPRQTVSATKTRSAEKKVAM